MNSKALKYIVTAALLLFLIMVVLQVFGISPLGNWLYLYFVPMLPLMIYKEHLNTKEKFKLLDELALIEYEMHKNKQIRSTNSIWKT